MSKKKRNLIIIISAIVALIVVLIILCFTTFSLKTIDVDFRTSTTNITATKEEIIESGKFKKGATVLFHSKKGYIKNIEKANPYIKVINIETIFPSKFVVHVVERQEVYAIEFNGGHYICDEELRVLRIDEAYSAGVQTPILFEPLSAVEKTYEVGQYINEFKVSEIYRYLYENNRKLGEQKAMIESVSLSKEYDSVLKQEQLTTTLKFYNGQTYKIKNSDYGMKFKVNLMLAVFSQYHDFVGKEISQGGDKIVLTEENLKDCTIVITNYYDTTKYSEKDCNFSIIVNSNFSETEGEEKEPETGDERPEVEDNLGEEI